MTAAGWVLHLPCTVRRSKSWRSKWTTPLSTTPACCARKHGTGGRRVQLPGRPSTLTTCGVRSPRSGGAMRTAMLPPSAIQAGSRWAAPGNGTTINNFTPPFPAYVSGHATFGAATFRVLARFFGTDNISFTLGSDKTPRRNSRLTTSLGSLRRERTAEFTLESTGTSMTSSGSKWGRVLAIGRCPTNCVPGIARATSPATKSATLRRHLPHSQPPPLAAQPRSSQCRDSRQPSSKRRCTDVVSLLTRKLSSHTNPLAASVHWGRMSMLSFAASLREKTASVKYAVR